MMTQTFGVGGARPQFYFDYQGNEQLDEGQISALKVTWTNQFLWRRYNELKTEMQSHMLPILLNQRIRSVNQGDSFEFKTGGSFAEVFISFLGALFQVDANQKHEERVRKRRRLVLADAAGAPAPADSFQLEDNEEDPAPAIAAGRNGNDRPEVWGDAHIAYCLATQFSFRFRSE